MTAEDSGPLADEDSLDHRSEWVDPAAAELLRGACAGILLAEPPQPDLEVAAARLRSGSADGDPRLEYFTSVCRWDQGMPANDVELWLQAAASTMSSPTALASRFEEGAAMAALVQADWFAMVVGLSRRGVGSEFSESTVLLDLEQTPEIDDDGDGNADDLHVIQAATAVLTPLWQSLDALDDDALLTRLGAWGLPNALYSVWSGAPSPV